MFLIIEDLIEFKSFKEFFKYFLGLLVFGLMFLLGVILICYWEYVESIFVWIGSESSLSFPRISGANLGSLGTPGGPLGPENDFLYPSIANERLQNLDSESDVDTDSSSLYGGQGKAEKESTTPLTSVFREETEYERSIRSAGSDQLVNLAVNIQQDYWNAVNISGDFSIITITKEDALSHLLNCKILLESVEGIRTEVDKVRFISSIYGYPDFIYPAKSGEFFFLEWKDMTFGDRVELAKDNESLSGMTRRLKSSADEAKRVLPLLTNKENKYPLLKEMEHSRDFILRYINLRGYRTRTGLNNILMELRRNNR